jgi:4-hydroxy-tetrahydrodipicolinate synthase
VPVHYAHDNDGKIDLNGQHISRLTEARIDVMLLMGSIGNLPLSPLMNGYAYPRSPRYDALTLVANVSSTCLNDVEWMAEKPSHGLRCRDGPAPYYYGQTAHSC